MGRRKNIRTPEQLWDLFECYCEIVDEYSIIGFQNFCSKTIGNVKMYFHPSTHTDFNNVVSLIKDEIYKNKVELYKKGLISHNKICKEAKKRGDDLGKKPLKIEKSNESQFAIENGLLSVKDKYLNKKHHSSKTLTSSKTPDTIYILNIQGSNIYKIGTSQNVRRRIKDICSSNPFVIDIIFVQKLLFAFEVEQSIHNLIEEFHIKNEWFKINDIDEIIDLIKKM